MQDEAVSFGRVCVLGEKTRFHLGRFILRKCAAVITRHTHPNDLADAAVDGTDRMDATDRPARDRPTIASRMSV